MERLYPKRNGIVVTLLVLSMIVTLGIFVFGLDDSVIQIYDTVLNQDADSGPIAITMGGETEVMTSYLHPSGSQSIINFTENGLYKVSYACAWESVGANGRHIMENWIRENGTTEIEPSRSSCYIRLSGTDGNRCSNSGTLLYNATAGSYIELMGDKLQGQAGVTDPHSDCSLYVLKVQKSIAQIFDSAGGDDIDGGNTTTSFDGTTYINSSTFQKVDDTINITQNGTYKVYYQTCYESTGQNSRLVGRSVLRLNNGSDIPPSASQTYIRETGTGDRNCNVGATLYNFSIGDRISLRSEKRFQEGAGATVLLVNQSWMVVELIESQDVTMLYEDAGGQSISDGNTASVTFDTQYHDGTETNFTVGQANVSFNSGGLYEISYNVGWDDLVSGGRHVVCAQLQKEGSNVDPSEQCDYSRGDAQGQYASVSGTYLISMLPGEEIELRVSTTGGNIDIEGNNTWINIRKLNQSFDIDWNQSTLDLGDTFVTTTNLSGLARVITVGDQTGINVTCTAGDCSVITSNVTSTFSMSGGSFSLVNFTCDNRGTGTFSALYGVNSTQVGQQDIINVSCFVDREFGTINIDFITPAVGSRRDVAQNQTFTVTANVSCTGTSDALCGNISTSLRRNATATFGSGTLGSLVVTENDTYINNYSSVVSSLSAGTTAIRVSDGAAFTANDEILVIQIQNGTGSGNAGTYEFATIQNVSGNNLTIRNPLSNTYGSGTFNASDASATQIVKIPHYTYVTINNGATLSAPAWNGTEGGILIFRASETLITNGLVNVSRLGYRGGSCNGCGNAANGGQGEGYSGLGDQTGNNQTNNDIGGGGGYGPSGTSGEPGGSGGHATAPGTSNSSFNSQGGSTVGSTDLSRIFFGGGAGAGGDDDNGNPPSQFAHGGGIAIIFAKQVNGAQIYAKGRDSFGAGGAAGITGAGAGGSLWLTTLNGSLTDVNVSGGHGFNDGDDLSPSGGEGRIRIDYVNITGHTDPLTGFNGSTFDQYLAMVDINTTSATPFWTTNANPQYCELNGTQSCLVSWVVNATGDINTTHLMNTLAVSNYSRVGSNITGDFTVNITEFVEPIVIAYLPINNSKFISNGTVSFVFLATDDAPQVNCTLIINGTNHLSTLCGTGSNTTLNISLAGGSYNWSVNVSDPDGFNASTNVSFFTHIIDRAIRVTKFIGNSGSSNMYTVRIFVENLLTNRTSAPTLIDFTYRNFVQGSFNVLYDRRDQINTTIYTGNTSIWNLTINATDTTEINYSMIGTEDYNLSNNVIVGIE